MAALQQSVQVPGADGSRAFEHHPLNSEAIRPIRLLRPAGVSNSSGLLRFQLSEHDLGTLECPGYLALSHTWGNDDPSHEILVNGAILTVRRNLHRFLVEFANEEEFIWIDQISIHQSDTRERNQQVQFMSEIYGQASSVVIWPHDSDSDEGTLDQRAMQFILRGEDNWERTFRLLQSLLSDHRRAAIQSASLETLHPSPRSVDEARQDWTDICAFSEKAYWRRLWIVQEILLANDAQLWAGGMRVPWLSVQRFFDFYDHTDFTTLELETELSDHFQNLCHDSKSRHHGFRGMQFIECISTYMTHECSDPRDTIYGLQGIIDPDQRLWPDYSKTKELVFIDTVAWSAIIDWNYIYLVELAVNMSLPTDNNVEKIMDMASKVPLDKLESTDGIVFRAIWLRYMLTDALTGSNTAFDRWNCRYWELPDQFWTFAKREYEAEGRLISEHDLKARWRCPVMTDRSQSGRILEMEGQKTKHFTSSRWPMKLRQWARLEKVNSSTKA